MDRLTELKSMAEELRSAFYDAEPRFKAALAKQYRETLREVDEIEGNDDGGDPIAELIAEHQQW